MEGLWGNAKIYDYLGLYLAHYGEYFHINGDAKKYKYLSVTNNYIFFHNSFKLFSNEYYKKNALPWIY